MNDTLQKYNELIKKCAFVNDPYYLQKEDRKLALYGSRYFSRIHFDTDNDVCFKCDKKAIYYIKVLNPGVSVKTKYTPDEVQIERCCCFHAIKIKNNISKRIDYECL